MTNKEKWNIALQEYICTSGIMEKARVLFDYPYTKLSSVDKGDVTYEKLFCTYCFENFNIKYSTNGRRYNEKVVCPHCKHEYARDFYNSSLSLWKKIRFDGGYYSKDRLIYFSAGKVNGKYGLVYIETDNAGYTADKAKKRLCTDINICSYGFVNEECRFYYRNGKFTAGRISCSSRYDTVEYFDEAAKECMKNWSVAKKNREQSLHYYLGYAEDCSTRSASPENSVSVKKAKQIMEAHPVRDAGELPAKDYPFILTRIVERNNLTHKDIYECRCLSCGHRYKTTVHRMSGVSRICPNCKTEATIISEATHYVCKETLYIDVSHEGELVLRVINHGHSFGNEFGVEHKEVERFYLFPSSKEMPWTWLRNDDGYFRLTKKANNPQRCFSEDEITVLPEAEEKLKYSGLAEYIGSSMSDTISALSVVKYLCVYFQHPEIEKIVKVGWKELADDYISDIIGTGKSNIIVSNGALHDIIGIPKRLMKHLADSTCNRPKYSDITELRKFVKMDENVRVADLEYLKQYNIIPDALSEIVGILGINIHQCCEYLERVRISQCMPPNSAVTEWRDYLRAAGTIEADLSDKTVRYPSSLKREHDRAVFKQKIILDKAKEENFQSVCREYGEKYVYEEEKYFVTVPKCMQDLFEEGRRLNHCVGSYADSIMKGKSCICFVRKKEHPDIPYFTVEILPYSERISQIKGLSNRAVDPTRDKGLWQFLKAWAGKKELSIA